MNPCPVIHGARPRFWYPLLFLALALTLIPLCCAAAPIPAVQGEDVPLRGTAPGLDVIYLFLTGPNLPDQGISLIGGTPVATGVPASFTRVEVGTDGSWAYTWRTGALGRILDAGTYTLYIVQEPLARPDLDDSVYAVQPVIFGAPVETAMVTVTESGGTLTVDSSPGLSTVTLDGRTAGITPVRISGIPAGSHTVVVTHEGYLDYRTDFVISDGETRDISAVLQALTPLSNPTTLVPTTTRPGRLAPPSPVAIGAVPIGILAFHFRRGIRRVSRGTE